jgi:hypothetical protein
MACAIVPRNAWNLAHLTVSKAVYGAQTTRTPLRIFFAASKLFT